MYTLICRPCLIRVDEAVLSGTAEIRVIRERDVGQFFQKSDAHNTGAFNARHVRHKTGVQNTQRPRVEDCSPRDPYKI